MPTLPSFNPYDIGNQEWAYQRFGKKPWEQQPGENLRAYAAFQVYLNMPPENRSLLGSFRLFKGKAGARTVPGLYSRWSDKWSWEVRAAFWDKFRDDTAKEAELKKLRELGEQRANAYMAVMRTGLTLLQKAELQNLKPDEARAFLALVPQLVDIGARGNRLEIGESERNVAVEVEVKRGRGIKRRRGPHGADADVDDDPRRVKLSLDSLEKLVTEAGLAVPPDVTGKGIALG